MYLSWARKQELALQCPYLRLDIRTTKRFYHLPKGTQEAAKAGLEQEVRGIWDLAE